jgi:hypothetical protein
MVDGPMPDDQLAPLLADNATVPLLSCRNFRECFTLWLPAELTERCEQEPRARSMVGELPYGLPADLRGMLVAAGSSPSYAGVSGAAPPQGITRLSTDTAPSNFLRKNICRVFRVG